MSGRIWNRKKQGQSQKASKTQVATVALPFEEVAKLCGSDEELCFVLERVLIATPPLLRIDEDIKTAVEKAEKAEKFEDKTSARVAYKEAGDLSVYKGDLDEARRYYQKCLEIDPEWTGRRVLEYFLGGDGEKAMRVIDRYYSKFRIFQKKEEAEGK